LTIQAVKKGIMTDLALAVQKVAKKGVLTLCAKLPVQ
jgi:hypothetical protein